MHAKLVFIKILCGRVMYIQMQDVLQVINLCCMLLVYVYILV